MRTTDPAEAPAALAPLRILHLEDRAEDAELCRQYLEQAGFQVVIDVVQTREEFQAQLAEGCHSLVLADYRLPGWNGLEALECLRQKQPGVPFILVTGSVGEETAVECLKRGATDYVLKDRLSRLPAAVGRALEELKLKAARARGEEALAHLAAIVESSDDAIIGTDLEGRVLSWHPAAARMLGCSAAEALGGALSAIVPSPPRRLSWEEVLARVSAGETVHNYEAGPVWKGDRQLLLSLTVSPVRDSQGRVAKAAVVARDVTRRRHLEHQLRLKNQALSEQNRRVEAANRMKSEFLAGMSHELRTPLNSVICLAELMHDGKLGPVSSEHREFLGDILNSSRHLLRLINDVLDLSRVESGRMELRAEPVLLERLVDEVRDVLRLLAARKQIEVAVEVSAEVSRVVADAARLKQVLYNYLSNALKFTPEGGRVWVRAGAVDAGSFRLEVEDTGIGIRPEDQPRLFQEFQQLDPERVRKYGGSGLGLALTKRIVEAQGGRVGVRSQPGRGSVFFAVLPRVITPSAPALGEPGPQLLLVEASPASAGWLESTLQRAGYRVRVAAAGVEAEAALRAQAFSAMVADLLLPDITAWELLASIRGAPLNRATPVVLVSVPGGEGLTAAFAVEDCLLRPVDAAAAAEWTARMGLHGGQAGTVLVVDGDPEALHEAEALLAPLGHRVIGRDTLEAGLKAVAEFHPTLVLAGLLMPDLEDLAGLLRLRRNSAGRRVRLAVWARRELFEVERERLNTMGQSLALRVRRGAQVLLGELAAVLKPGGEEANLQARGRVRGAHNRRPAVASWA